MIDFHSHVLPSVDDGAKNVETAAEMLMLSKSQGVDTVVATSHFYPDKMSIEEFLEKRHQSYQSLMQYIEENNLDVPDIKLGAEVRFSHELMAQNPERLKIEGTDTILIELPFTRWNDWVYNDLFELTVRHKLNVVIAHLERYVDNEKDLEHIQNLFELDVYIQVNADSFLDRRKKKVIKALLKKYRIDLIGTDMHNLDTRKTHMDKAVKVLKKSRNIKYFVSMKDNARDLLGM